MGNKTSRIADDAGPTSRVFIADRDSMSTDLLANALVRNGRSEVAASQPADRELVQDRSLSLRIDSAPQRHTDQIRHPVYHQDWWLSIARGKARVEEARVVDHGIVVAKLVYGIYRNKSVLIWRAALNWTHLNGPIINKPLTGEETQKVVAQLLAQLPRGRSYNFVVRATEKNIHAIREAFKAAKFEHTQRKTYLQAPTPAPDNLSRMDSKHRGHFKRAQRDLDVFEIDSDTYIEFYRVNIEAIGKKSHTPLGVAFDLLTAAQNRTPSQAVILAARRKSDGSAPLDIIPLDAAVAILMDDTRAYLWGVTYRRALPGRSENKPNADAVKLLILKAAEYAAERRLTFDTDGLRNEGSEHLYRDILKFREVEQLDVFERRTVVIRLFQAAKPFAMRAGAYMRSGKVLLSRLPVLRKETLCKLSHP